MKAAVEQPFEESIYSGRLARIATRLNRVTAKVYREHYGLSVPEFCVLSILGDKQGIGCTSSAIVEASAMDKTKVSRAVSALDRRGWVTRMRTDSDRRFEHLALTEAGHSAFCSLMPKVQEAEEALLSRLELEERNALRTALKALDRVCGYGSGDRCDGFFDPH